MPQYLNTLFTQLVALVNTTWTDVATGGVYRFQEFARIPFDQKAPSLPCVVIDTSPIPWPERPLVARADLVQVTISRVIRDVESYATLITKCEDLRTTLHPDNPATRPLAAAQIFDWPRISDSPSLPVNDYILRTAKPCYVGTVIVQIVIGA